MKRSDLELELAFKEARKRWGESAFASYRDISTDGNANCEVGRKGNPNADVDFQSSVYGRGSTWAEAFENADK